VTNNDISPTRIPTAQIEFSHSWCEQAENLFHVECVFCLGRNTEGENQQFVPRPDAEVNVKRCRRRFTFFETKKSMYDCSNYCIKYRPHWLSDSSFISPDVCKTFGCVRRVCESKKSGQEQPTGQVCYRGPISFILSLKYISFSVAVRWLIDLHKRCTGLSFEVRSSR
jgi:hypothetical protein